MEPQIGTQYVFCRTANGVTECVRFIRREDGSASIWSRNEIADWEESEEAWKLVLDDLHSRGFTLDSDCRAENRIVN